MPRPRVIVHTAISLDGRIDGFEPDVAVYYELIGTWNEGATLCGSETILAAEPQPDPTDAALEGADPDDRRPLLAEGADPDDGRPLLAVVDSRGRVRSWKRLIRAGHWRAGLALCSNSTPAEHLAYLRDQNIAYEIVGSDRVDLGTALASLAERGVECVRIDAGPTLNGLVLRAGLVDELSLVVHPVISGEGRPFADGLDSAVGMRRISSEARGELLWLRFAAD
jgi:2,5-diamino-6-(ribosylamino)-4(3H)-pyrimidinone 5'-phosphate reductase